jgi:hypothetical protein
MGKAGLAEYAMVLALIIAVAIAILIAFGDQINKLLGN